MIRLIASIDAARHGRDFSASAADGWLSHAEASRGDVGLPLPTWRDGVISGTHHAPTAGLLGAFLPIGGDVEDHAFIERALLQNCSKKCAAPMQQASFSIP